LAQIMNAPVVRCDEIAWDLFGISMAGWNMLISLGLVALWIIAARRARA
jgi:disulfide bond formation protein DsbB